MSTSVSTPPFVPGLPLLGNALEFRRDALGLFRRGYERFGPVFGIKLAFKPAVVLVGPEHNRFFFESTDRVLSMSEVYQFLVPIVGGKVLFTASPDEYKEQRRIMRPAFVGRKLRGYVTEMANETNEWLNTLGEQGQFELIETAERLTMMMAARAIMGERFRRELGPELARLFVDLSGGLEFILPTNLPLPRFIRRDRALRAMQKMLREVVVDRRKNPDQYDDFLQVLVTATYMGNEAIPDDVVVTMLIGLMFGGRENTAGHLEWGIVQILQHPEFRVRALGEIDEVLAGDAPLTESSLKEMRWLEWCMKETERLRPMTHLLVRLTREAYTAGGYHIPRGWLTVAGIALSQRLPDLFRDPERYDPGRFAPDRGEDPPYGVVGFGAGPHRCWAVDFVYSELKVITALLLRRYEVELVNANPRSQANDIGVMRPERPCWVRYRRRTL